MIWERGHGPLKANTAMAFRFSVADKDGKPARDLEPYMGMAGHAEFVRSDLSVFAHVHPAGSVPMASLEMAQAWPNWRYVLDARWNDDGTGVRNTAC